MKRTEPGTLAGTAGTLKSRAGRAVPVALAAVAILLLAGCQIGTGDVELFIAPSEIEYTNVTVEFREYYQLTARDIDTGVTVSGYPVEISMSFAAGSGGPVIASYWALEDRNRGVVLSPWRTETGSDGTVRFFVHFAGTGLVCGEWGYTVQAYGEEGSATFARTKNTCEDD